jgi:LysR family transcriptional regulator, glycine cleavage system transcriptional activator
MDANNLPQELPPIVLLRAFDAAGRHGSFKAAAAYLHVTPSTISHQIADLECYLGVQLFHRLPRGLSLTSEGSALLADVALAFGRLREATARLRMHGQPVVIRISANPYLAAEILVPMIEAFEAEFPHHSIHISATEVLEDPGDGGIDFCVRFGDGNWPGVEAQALYPVSGVPVIAAQLDDIEPARIDYPFRGQSAWQTWQSRGGESVRTGKLVRSFNGYGAAMRAAEQGLGVTLALWPVVQPWIRAARIRRYGTEPGIALGVMYLLNRPLTPAQTTLRAVRDWLVKTLVAVVQ